jgi:hypothetical protein
VPLANVDLYSTSLLYLSMNQIGLFKCVVVESLSAHSDRACVRTQLRGTSYLQFLIRYIRFNRLGRALTASLQPRLFLAADKQRNYLNFSNLMLALSKLNI